MSERALWIAGFRKFGVLEEVVDKIEVDSNVPHDHYDAEETAPPFTHKGNGICEVEMVRRGSPYFGKLYKGDVLISLNETHTFLKSFHPEGANMHTTLSLIHMATMSGPTKWLIQRPRDYQVRIPCDCAKFWGSDLPFEYDPITRIVTKVHDIPDGLPNNLEGVVFDMHCKMAVGDELVVVGTKSLVGYDRWSTDALIKEEQNKLIREEQNESQGDQLLALSFVKCGEHPERSASRDNRERERRDNRERERRDNRERDRDNRERERGNRERERPERPASRGNEERHENRGDGDRGDGDRGDDGDGERPAKRSKHTNRTRTGTREDDDNAANEDGMEDGTEDGTEEYGKGTREDTDDGTEEYGKGTRGDTDDDEDEEDSANRNLIKFLTLEEAKNIKYKEKFKNITVQEIYEWWFGISAFKNNPMPGGIAAVMDAYGNSWCGKNIQLRRMKQIALSIKNHMEKYRTEMMGILNSFATENGSHCNLTHIHKRLTDAGLLEWDEDVIEKLRSITNSDEENESGDN